MPVTKTITLYQYDELPTDKAKETAREWFKAGADYERDAWDMVTEDAKNIGLKIESLRTDQSSFNHGEFIDGAFNCAVNIFANHGDKCATWVSAKAWETTVDKLEETQSHLGCGSDKYNEALDALESDFMAALLQGYLKMYEDELFYLYSDSNVEEGIRANEYTFRDNGKREDV